MLEVAEQHKHRLQRDYAEFTEREIMRARSDLRKGLIESVFFKS